MRSHTRGPWTLTHVAGGNFAVQRFELRGMLFDAPNTYPIFQRDLTAIDGATFCSSPEDARLIAAAPDLLDACEAVWELLQGWELRSPNPKAREAISKCRDALAKARCPRETDGERR